MSNTDILRQEYNRPSFKQLCKDNLGCKCINCGSDKDIQYHHIVPLALGGTNRLSNIVPLCYSCHRAAHHGQHLTHYRKKSDSEGRPPLITYEDAEPILDKYFQCEIDTESAWKSLGYSGTPRMGDKNIVKEYKKKHGIISSRNNINVCMKNGELYEGRVVGYIKYRCGKRVEFLYKP